ncbi:diflavin oxidoreductase, partial [Arthrobacter sp. H41]|uniref:diflavin oxidoreductase n=1 Tax=Arthrobacter sp. H41 TaxID=1312978 RepID=UPI0015649FE6
AADSERQGYVPSLSTMDSAAGHLPTEGPVVVVTASYEGLPPDNARKFLSWAAALPARSLEGVSYAVFGCGNRDWARTYQAVPRLIDESLARAGGARILERGEADARGDFFGGFEDWYAGFWNAVENRFHRATRAPAAGTTLEVEFTGGVLGQLLRSHGLVLGTLTASRELVDLAKPGGRSTKHLEFALPEGLTYCAGDYLEVLPLNPADVVHRALTRFGLAGDDQLVIRRDPRTDSRLPIGVPMRAGDLLSGYVELSQPATRRQVGELAAATPCVPERRRLQTLVDDVDEYARRVLDHRRSVLDLLLENPAVQVPFAAFLRMLAPLTPRQYSISSSARCRKDHATLTVTALRERGHPPAAFRKGVCSAYLMEVQVGDRVALGVKPATQAFQPPADSSTPMILVCAGSGIAPFRGFLQDRALQAEETGLKAGPALLFFGCRAPDTDFLYRTELASWEEQGVVEVLPAYSRYSGGGPRYVQDRLWADRARVVELMDQGARFYVCGDGPRMASAVRAVFLRIHREERGGTGEEAAAWLEDLEGKSGRYVTEVFR